MKSELRSLKLILLFQVPVAFDKPVKRTKIYTSLFIERRGVALKRVKRENLCLFKCVKIYRHKKVISEFFFNLFFYAT